MPNAFGQESFWLESAGDRLEPRRGLAGDERADVVIVGAGYTGLWTAYYLKALARDIDIALVESEIAGYGASGRNGGWCSAEFAGIEGLLSDPATRAGGQHLQRLMFDAVDEVGRVAEAETIECHYTKGGMVTAATSPGQKAAQQEYLSLFEAAGFGDDFHWLEAPAARQHIHMEGMEGAVYSPHCAVIQPARLARGLARVLDAKGVRLYEQSPVTGIEQGRVTTERGSVTAPVVVIATEAYSRTIPGLARRLLPLHSQIIATEPLSGSVLDQIGLGHREAFADGRRLVTYGQRTADDRIVFGYRAGYRYGSKIVNKFDRHDASFLGMREMLGNLFPVLNDVPITHAWGGALGLARSRSAFIDFDRRSGLVWCGGYTGSGVAASNLGGRTVADLILGRDSERVSAPWVHLNRHPINDHRKWEPEPLRWIGVSALLGYLKLLDRLDSR